MSLVNNRRRPWENLTISDFFDTDAFLSNRFWTRDVLDEDFHNGKSIEPALNIKETDKAYEVELAAPGFSKKDFEVTIQDGCLNISAENSSSREENDDNYTRQEFSYSSFEKSLPLPDSVKKEDVKAAYKDGILSFKLLKKKDAKSEKPKKIEIA